MEGQLVFLQGAALPPAARNWKTEAWTAANNDENFNFFEGWDIHKMLV